MRAHVGGYVWADSPLHRLRASAKVVGLVAAVALVVAAAEPVALGAAALGVAALVAVSRVGVRRALEAVWALRWFFAILVALNAFLFSDVDPLFSLGPVHLTVEGLTQGGRIAARVALVAVLGALLTATTRPQELVAGVRELLSPLAHLGVPTEAVALAVGITVQFVPTLLRESGQLIRAQAARGALAEGGLVARVSGFVRLLVPVFVAAFRRADELSLAMEARGYRLEPPGIRPTRCAGTSRPADASAEDVEAPSVTDNPKD